MPRLIASVLSVHLVIGLIGLAWIFWRSRDPAVVELSAIGAGSSDPALVEALRAQAAGAATTWWASLIALSALSAAGWLIAAHFRQPGTPQQARGATGAWWVSLLVALLLSFAIDFVMLGDDALAQSWRLALIGVGTAALVLAYYLSTALGVKIAMSPSVPLATVFRR